MYVVNRLNSDVNVNVTKSSISLFWYSQWISKLNKNKETFSLKLIKRIIIIEKYIVNLFSKNRETAGERKLFETSFLNKKFADFFN